jgi:multiple antibiotic resistance protein
LNEQEGAANSRKKQEETDVRDEAKKEDLELKAFYPFTFPITSGPGTLVALLTLTAHISDRNLTKNILAHIGVFLAVVVLSVLVYFCYAYAPRISRAIPQSTAHGILRVVAFILVCIGAQIAWNGLSVLLGEVVKR